MTAIQVANSLLEDVNSLLDHHPAQKDPKPGKPAGPGYGPLLRAGTSLCYTAWEVYVEESLTETVEWLLENKKVGELPEALRSWVAEQSNDPWAFVGDSWQSTVLDLVQSRIQGDEQGRYGFNTASVSGVESLYSNILGYCPLREIKWQKKNQRVRAKRHLVACQSTRRDCTSRFYSRGA